MSTSENTDLKPNSTVPISDFGALFSLNPSNAFTVLTNSNSFDAPCRIETAYETPPVLANLIANSSVITGDSPFEIVTDISKQNSVLQLISDSDLSIVKTEVETLEDFGINPCNSNTDQNASQTKTLSTVTQNTEIHGVGGEGFPKRNEHLKNPDAPNPLISVCVSSDHVKDLRLPAKLANLKSVLKPVQQVNATAKSVVRIAEDSSSKGDSTSYQGVKDSNPRNQHIVVSEEVTKDLELLKRYFIDNKCLICGFISKHLRNGYRHMVVHMTVKPYQCEQCPKAFATERGLTSHQLIHTDNSKSSKFTCSTCGKCFERQSYLKCHEDRHVPVVRHKCEICQKGFSRMQQLRRHARTHTGERPYVCNICGDSFVKSCSFKKHTNIHTKEIAYKCDICQKVFYSSNYFNVHMRAHGQGDVFQCDICNATFNFKSNLAQHKLTHSENRSHKCNECGKTFKLPHHLRQHLQTHQSGGASSRKRKTPESKRVQYDYSDDEDFDLPNEDYLLPGVDVKIFPVIKEEN